MRRGAAQHEKQEPTKQEGTLLVDSGVDDHICRDMFAAGVMADCFEMCKGMLLRPTR